MSEGGREGRGGFIASITQAFCPHTNILVLLLEEGREKEMTYKILLNILLLAQILSISALSSSIALRNFCSY